MSSSRTQQASLPVCYPHCPFCGKQESCECHILKSFGVTWEMNPRSTDSKSDALTTTPTRRPHRTNYTTKGKRVKNTMDVCAWTPFPFISICLLSSGRLVLLLGGWALFRNYVCGPPTPCLRLISFVSFLTEAGKGACFVSNIWLSPGEVFEVNFNQIAKIFLRIRCDFTVFLFFIQFHKFYFY